jgi:signal transduction histidine kinase
MSGGQTEALEHLAALERLERIIGAFASMVSHQTRSALVGIQGLSELILQGDLSSDEVRAFAEDIFREAQKIDATIGEMFDLNRLETGQSQFRHVAVDLNQVVAGAVTSVREKTRLVGFVVEPAGGLLTVTGDPDRLRQAVQKLLGFVVGTAVPGSRITLATCRHQNQVELRVRSSSMRVVEFEDWLFGRYDRYEKRPSAIMGVGLGLAITRAVVELHGGSISVETPAEGGAEFRVMLPAPAA